MSSADTLLLSLTHSSILHPPNFQRAAARTARLRAAWSQSRCCIRMLHLAQVRRRLVARRAALPSPAPVRHRHCALPRHAWARCKRVILRPQNSHELVSNAWKAAPLRRSPGLTIDKHNAPSPKRGLRLSMSLTVTLTARAQAACKTRFDGPSGWQTTPGPPQTSISHIIPAAGVFLAACSRPFEGCRASPSAGCSLD